MMDNHNLKLREQRVNRDAPAPSAPPEAQDLPAGYSRSYLTLEPPPCRGCGGPLRELLRTSRRRTAKDGPWTGCAAETHVYRCEECYGVNFVPFVVRPTGGDLG